MTERTPDEWVREYAACHHTYVAFAQRLEALVNDLLDAGGIDVVQVESRAKTVASFGEKIRRKGRNDLEDPFASLTDLVGIRVITYYLDDVTAVGRLLQREFAVDAENSADKLEALASDQFGYRSAHYVAKLIESRSALVEWQSFAHMPVEFQVRTSLQHAWAAISHKIDYKSASEAPSEIRRRLFRLSALFELADEQFAAVRDQRAAATEAYGEDVARGELDLVPIDTESLTAYWRSSPTVEKLLNKLWAESRLTPDEGVEGSRLNRDRKDLVRVLHASEISTLSDLENYLANSDKMDSLIDALDQVDAKMDPVEGPTASGTAFDVLTMMLMLDHPDSAPDNVYQDGYADVLKSVGKSLR